MRLGYSLRRRIWFDRVLLRSISVKRLFGVNNNQLLLHVGVVFYEVFIVLDKVLLSTVRFIWCRFSHAHN